MGRLDGKAAIITGAASGMGRAAADLFTKEGAKVTATDRAVDTLNKEMDALGRPDQILALEMDVSSEASWKDVVDQTVAKWGKIDILINNAGVFWVKSLLDETLDGFNKMLGINLVGVWLGMREVIPHMQKNGKGSIVNTSSVAGIMGGPENDAGGAAYSAAKGGVRSITKHAAQFYAKDNIRVNSVHPGGIFTGIIKNMMPVNTREEALAAMGGQTASPLPRGMGEPYDIAYGYLYLDSDESKFVTGEELVIDGGQISH